MIIMSGYILPSMMKIRCLKYTFVTRNQKISRKYSLTAWIIIMMMNKASKSQIHFSQKKTWTYVSIVSAKYVMALIKSMSHQTNVSFI